MYLDYSIIETLNLLISSILEHTMMWIIIVCSLIYGFILHINSRVSKYLILIVNLLLIFLILYYYHNYLFSKLIFIHFNHNIFFYFLSSIIYLITVCILLTKEKKIYIIHYIFILILLLYSLFITHLVHNIPLITIGNIYPMIVIGNYLYFGYYIFIIIKMFKRNKK